MSKYDIILLERVQDLGNAGEQKSVKKGYALNYLIPQGLALPVTKDTVNRLASIRKKEVKRLEELKKEVAGTAEALEGQSFTFEVATTDDGKLYGSIDAGDLVKQVNAKCELDLNKKSLSLKNPIKEAGETKVSVDLHPEVQPKITVIVKGIMTEAQKKKQAEKEKLEKAKQEQEEADAIAKEEEAAAIDEDIANEEKVEETVNTED